jgi:hypothetical protein
MPSDKNDQQFQPIESHILRPWEQEQTFNDVLYEWMGRAPFLAIAFAIHLFAFFILSAIPMDTSVEKTEQVIQASIPPPPEDPFEEPEEPEEIEEVEEVVEEEVEFTDEVVEDVVDSNDEVDLDAPESPFNSDQWNDAIGLGGGAGGGGGKIGRRKGGRTGVKKEINKALLSGLEWLKAHQSDDGRWDCDGFPNECDRGGELCDGIGEPNHDVGVTGLALLAFLGFGDSLKEGTYQPQIKAGVAWLLKQQDKETGLLGQAVGHEFLYNHSIAALALCEAYYSDKGNPLLKKAAQNSINYISRARNPYYAWRYEVPPNGDNDTSVTGWMVFALAAARDAELEVSYEDFRGALTWFDDVTDPATGRTGYLERNGQSSRLETLADRYPRELTEAMTAVAMLCRVFIEDIVPETAKQEDILRKGGDLLLERLPEWTDDGSTCDMYYWYYGSYAMFQMGGIDASYWSKWEKAMEKAILPNQRLEPPCYDGSWDPIGPWGYAGGRVYSTACMVLCLEVFFRYGNVLGARGEKEKAK